MDENTDLELTDYSGHPLHLNDQVYLMITPWPTLEKPENVDSKNDFFDSPVRIEYIAGNIVAAEKVDSQNHVVYHNLRDLINPIKEEYNNKYDKIPIKYYKTPYRVMVKKVEKKELA